MDYEITYPKDPVFEDGLLAVWYKEERWTYYFHPKVFVLFFLKFITPTFFEKINFSGFPLLKEEIRILQKMAGKGEERFITSLLENFFLKVITPTLSEEATFINWLLDEGTGERTRARLLLLILLLENIENIEDLESGYDIPSSMIPQGGEDEALS